MFGFNKNREENQSAINEQQIANADNVLQSARPEIREEDFIDNSEPEGNKSEDVYQVAYGTGFAIDLIYGFLKRDFEQKGFDDAMVNPESS